MEYLLGALILFVIVHVAAYLAVRPLLLNLKRQKETSEEEKLLGLKKLRDIGLLDQREFGEMKDRYKQKGNQTKEYEEYLDYLYELKENGYSSEKYMEKVSKLKKHFDHKL